MDKVEYHQKLDELTGYVQQKDYTRALQVAEEVDWRRVKSIRTLNMVADVYEVNKNYQKTKEILKIAYSRSSIGRGVLYRLTEICLKLKQTDEAQNYFDKYSQVAQGDASRYLLQYKLFKAKNMPLESRIAVLQEYREREYTERWAYELAYLYYKANNRRKCVEACDDLILWFSEGKYVRKALELKKKYEPLSPSQQALYEEEKRKEVFPTVKPEHEEPAGPASTRVMPEVIKIPAAYFSGEPEPAPAEEVSAAAEAVQEAPAAEDAAPEESGRSLEEKAGDFKDKLAKGLRDVFSGMKQAKDDPEEEDADEAAEAAREDLANLKVKDLEPERLETEFSAGDRLVPPTPIVESGAEEEFNLEKFLSETAGSFSSEISTGNYVEREVAEEPLPAEEETAEDPFEPADEQFGEVSQADVHPAASAQDALQAFVRSSTGEIALEEDEDEAVLKKADEPRKPKYNPELEIPDPEPTEEENKARTIPLNKLGQNTVPITIDKLLKEETPEERRIRFLNKAKPSRMSDEQRKIFTYFARIPGMDAQILDAMGGVYKHAGEKTSLHGNIAVMGAKGTGKSHLSEELIVAMCRDLDMEAAKVARIRGRDLNRKDAVAVVSQMAGGFLMIENAGEMTPETVESLNQAMAFRTDCMVVIIEDEKTAMRTFLKTYPNFAAKFDTVISIPVFTNDELVTFARTYATDNGCKLDDMGILALYTQIGNNQSEDKPITISDVKEMVDTAIEHASRSRRGRRTKGKWLMLQERDFDRV